MTTIAAVQFTAGERWSDHADKVHDFIKEAAGKGAQLVALPENCSGMVSDRARQLAEAVVEAEHPAVAELSAWAAELKVWILCGSLALKMAGETKLTNRSLLFSPEGKIAARYDKIHLFSADLGQNERYRESDYFSPGNKAVVTQAAGLKLGMTICHDLRYPTLYQTLVGAGAEIIAVPSAFAVPTGKAHWEVLLRARAIETGCFVLAPGQTGLHSNGRRTYGHSLIVDPWGVVLADGGDAEGVITASFNKDQLAEVRRSLIGFCECRPFDLAAQSM